MLREIGHFVRNLPAAKRMRDEMGRAEMLEFIEREVDAAGKARWRADLVADIAGDVLEIGAGTGAMFPYYKRGVCLTATDPDEEYLKQAAANAKQSAAQIIVRPARGESLPFPNASFDAAVSTGVLCQVQSVERTLAEVKRVLKAGAQFRLCEHVRSDHLISGLVMDMFTPVWFYMSQVNCYMNRNVEASLKAAGFVLERVERFQLFPAKFPMAFPYRAIWAVSPRSVP